jgi:hypothetical protein
MIVTAVDDGRALGGAAALADALVRLLAGRPPDHAVTAGDLKAPSIVARSAVVVIAASVGGGPVSDDVLALADARPFAPQTLVVPASMGLWPAEAVTLARALMPRLLGSGTHVTPVLHVPSADAPAIGLFCRRWAPMVARLAGPVTDPADGRAA